MMINTELNKMVRESDAGRYGFFMVNGQVVFPVYGRNGGLTTHYIAYLIDGYGWVFAFEINPDNPAGSVYDAVTAFQSNAKFVGEGGGDLGLPSHLERRPIFKLALFGFRLEVWRQ